MPVGVAAILVTLGGVTAYLLAWVTVLGVREVLNRRALRRVEFALIAHDVAEVQTRSRHAPPETAGAVRVDLPVPAQRQRVVCPAQPNNPSSAAGHTTSPRHARVAS